MLSSSDVLPERYGPHSATTRCAPLPGLPPVMFSLLMSFMTTSSRSARMACAEKLRTVWSHPNSAAGAMHLSKKCFHSAPHESTRPLPDDLAVRMRFITVGHAIAFLA